MQKERRYEAQVIPFPLIGLEAARAMAAGCVFRTGTRTLRPLDVLLLLPLIIPVGLLTLALLTVVFVLWLGTVAAMTTAIVATDVGHAVLWRFGGSTLDPRAVSYQGR